MNDLPNYLNLLFILTALATAFLFYKAARNSTSVLLIILGWFLLQGLIGFNGFYLETTSLPPRILLLIAPPFVAIFIFFFTKRGKNFIDRLDLKFLTSLHTVRLPVEITLMLLFLHQQIPQIMTFEGRNFDIVSGISAPIIAFIYFRTQQTKKKLLLFWNFVCLALVLNIMIHGILSAPFPFQQFGFEQPNIGVLKFPFIWLPGFIVPVVIFSHLVSIRQLLKKA
jgi:hypothetical protein